MNFSENLKRCKDERGYTIEELSRRSSVPVGTLSKLLSGVIAEPKMAVVLALAKGLSCSLSHLLDPTGEYISETLDEEERFAIYTEALDMVMELAVEFPVYQRNDLFVYDKTLIDAKTLNQNPSTNSGLLDRIWEVNYL